MATALMTVILVAAACWAILHILRSVASLLWRTILFSLVFVSVLGGFGLAWWFSLTP